MAPQAPPLTVILASLDVLLRIYAKRVAGQDGRRELQMTASRRTPQRVLAESGILEADVLAGQGP